MDHGSTKQKILDSAEKLFAEAGIPSVSIRSIVAEAGVNLASIHYHFGSKDGLVRAVLQRRIQAVNKTRLELLAGLKDLHGDKPVPVKELIRAFLAPAFEMGRDEAHGGQKFFQAVARAHAETNPAVQEELYKQLREVVQVFLSELGRSIPQVSRAELGIRLTFTAGAMVQAILLPIKPGFLEKLVSDESLSNERMLDMLVAYCSAGFEGKAGGGESG